MSNTDISSVSALSDGHELLSQFLSTVHHAGCVKDDLHFRVIHLFGIFILFLAPSQLKPLYFGVDWVPFCSLCLALTSTKT